MRTRINELVKIFKRQKPSVCDDKFRILPVGIDPDVNENEFDVTKLNLEKGYMFCCKLSDFEDRNKDIILEMSDTIAECPL